jgi:hypothetical protein
MAPLTSRARVSPLEPKQLLRLSPQHVPAHSAGSTLPQCSPSAAPPPHSVLLIVGPSSSCCRKCRVASARTAVASYIPTPDGSTTLPLCYYHHGAPSSVRPPSSGRSSELRDSPYLTASLLSFLRLDLSSGETSTYSLNSQRRHDIHVLTQLPTTTPQQFFLHRRARSRAFR